MQGGQRTEDLSRYGRTGQAGRAWIANSLAQQILYFRRNALPDMILSTSLIFLSSTSSGAPRKSFARRELTLCDRAYDFVIFDDWVATSG